MKKPVWNPVFYNLWQKTASVSWRMNASPKRAQRASGGDYINPGDFAVFPRSGKYVIREIAERYSLECRGRKPADFYMNVYGMRG